MALNEKNIVIVPNIGSNNEPSIVFSATDASSSVQNISLFAYPTSNGTLSFETNNGQLFSVTNSVEGSIFSVNDISGIPSIEVLDNGTVKVAQYTGNILLGTATDNTIDKLQINGSITSAGIIKSTVPQGSSPFNITSNTLVSNLNSQLLNGQPAAYYLATSSLVGTLAVANGGTGVTTSTGTGSVVLNNSPTFAGTITANNISYTGSLTGGTGIINIDSGDIYKTVSGNVGIGTLTPNEKLVVNGAIQSLSGNNTLNNTNHVGYTFTNDGDTGMFNNSAGFLYLSTNGNDIVRIENSNVGIGKSPTVAFDVNGQVKSTSISTGIIDASGQVKSSVAQGTSPFTVNSTTSVANLTIGGTASGLSSTLSVSSGGTGLVSLTSNNVIIGSGTAAVQFVAPGAVNNVLKSDGTNWISSTTPQGTVTSVTGTSPILSTGGATPVISIQVANSSQSGYLSSTNWTTFNNKANTNQTVLTGLTTIDRLIFANTAVPAANLSILTIESLLSQTSATYNIVGIKTDFKTTATAYTIQSITHYLANSSFSNFGESVTNVYGFHASSNAFLSGVVSTGYGFYGELSGTGRYNLYMAGSAPNYLKGSLLIDSVNNGTDKVQINGSVNVTSGIISTDYGFNAKVAGTSVGQFNAVANSATAGTGWSKVILRNDGTDFYILTTSNGSSESAVTTGSWNNYRPFSFNIVTGTVTISGNTQQLTRVGGQLQSLVAQGTAPFIVSSTTKITNLNADLLDDLTSSSLSTANTIVSRDTSANFSANQITSTATTGVAPFVVSSTTVVANLNADLLDGKTSASTATADTMVLRDATGGIFANSGTFSGNISTPTLSATSITTGSQTINGQLKIVYGIAQSNTSGDIWITSQSGSILLDDNAHKRISWNDGGGNFNIRSGNYYNGTNTVYAKGSLDTNGGASSIVFVSDLSDGAITLSVAPIGSPGANVSFTKNLTLSTTGLFLDSNTILDTGNYTTYSSPKAGSSSLITTGTITSGLWNASIGTVSGANLTSLTAANLSGTIPTAVLGNSTLYVGTTAIPLNRASASLALTGISGINSITSLDLSSAAANTIALDSGTTGAVNIGTGATAKTISIGNISVSSAINLNSNTTYTGNFTGSTGILNIGSGQLYKDVSGNIGIGNLSPAFKLEIGSTSDTTLGPNIGNQILQQRFNAKNSGNQTALEISNIRLANSSSDWNTAGYRIQQRVDASYQAYIQFNGSYNSTNNPFGISFGTGTSTTANGSIERLRINVDGNVGIGTASPSKILHIATNTGNCIYLEDNNNSNASPTVRIRGWRGDLNGSQAFSGGLVLERRCDTAVGADSALGTIYFGGNYNTTPNFGYAASISAFSDGAFTSNTNTPTALVFHTGITPILDTNIANFSFGIERMRIDSSGNVGIGTNNPTEKLMVNAGNIWSNEGYFRTSRSSASGVTVSGLVLQIDNTTQAQIITPLSGSMAMYTAGTERIRIDSSGNVTLQNNISVGGAAPTTSGTGITFPATQSASNDANTLDDYEEGTWTPVLTSGFTANGTVTRFGSYTKIGRVVSVNFVVQANTVSPANGAVLSGLPFATSQYGIGLSTNMGGSATAMSVTISGSTLIFGGISISTPNLIGSITYITT